MACSSSLALSSEYSYTLSLNQLQCFFFLVIKVPPLFLCVSLSASLFVSLRLSVSLPLHPQDARKSCVLKLLFYYKYYVELAEIYPAVMRLFFSSNNYDMFSYYKLCLTYISESVA